MTTLDQLIDLNEPAWPEVSRWLRESAHRCEIVPVDRARSEQTLYALQRTTGSPLGAVALETAGVLFDDGWLRLLGGGGPGLEGDLARWNGLGANPLRPALPGGFLIGYDVLGGFFAINAGAFASAGNSVIYLAPDSLKWEDLERGYGDFLRFLCTGDLAKFYASYRWPSWERDVSQLSFDRVFAVAPPLWTKEGKPLERQTRRAIPALEALSLNLELSKQLETLPDGASVAIKVTD